MTSLRPTLHRRFMFAALLALVLLPALASGAKAQFGEERFLHLQDPNAKRAPAPSWFPFGRRGNSPGDQLPADAQPKKPAERIDYSKAPAAKPRSTPADFNVLVIGDSLADWLGYGLDEAFLDVPEVGVARLNDDNAGLIRQDGVPWLKLISDRLATSKNEAIVLLYGLNERQPIRTGGGKPGGDGFEPGSPEWQEAYGKRLEGLFELLRGRGVPVFVVGMPPLRGTRTMQENIAFNDLLRERAARANLTFVDVWDGFVDENGAFQTHGPDFAGQNRRLRSGDGVHFTKAGARKLAHYVERDLRRLILARTAPASLPASEPAPTEPKAPVPGKPLARPLAGPVVQLTGRSAVPMNAGGVLLGGGPRRALPQDEMVRRLLREGQAPDVAPGRADDAAWPRQ